MADRGGVSTIMAEWAQVVSALVGAVAAVAAVVVGLQTIKQGEQQNEEARTQQTLEFFATFNTPNMLRARELLDNEDWCSRYGYFTNPDYQSAAIGTDVLSSQHIVSVVDFFDAIHNSCPPNEAEEDGGLCDRRLAERLFSAYAADLYDNLSKAIFERRRQRGDTFGEGMASLAGEQAPLEEVVARFAQESCGVNASR
jgi:hypothetical protein